MDVMMHTSMEKKDKADRKVVFQLVYPLDTLKTRYQSPDYKKIYYDASKNAINRKVLFRGLYQGVGSIILITIPSCTPLSPNTTRKAESTKQEPSSQPTKQPKLSSQN